jgi:hypothetical protein
MMGTSMLGKMVDVVSVTLPNVSLVLDKPLDLVGLGSVRLPIISGWERRHSCSTSVDLARVCRD